MDRRTFESPMEWEYQNAPAMDPTSPFTHFSARTHSYNSNTQSQSQNQNQSQSQSQSQSQNQHRPITPGSFGQPPLHRTATAPPFRNTAFTTPRKPFDADVSLSELSACGSSPAETSVLLDDTPETERRDNRYNTRNFSQMTITPARINPASKSRSPVRSPGKGQLFPLLRSVHGTGSARDRVRKRKRYPGDKDISGLRLTYKHAEELDDDDEPESDDSTYHPHHTHSQKHQLQRHHQLRKDQNGGSQHKPGFVTALLGTIQSHPYVPAILIDWLSVGFQFIVIGISIWLIWIVINGFRDDFFAAREELRAGLLEEMAGCAKHFVENRCDPPQQRLPAMQALCEEWRACVDQDPDRVRRVKLGAKNMVEIFNEILEAMHWKTMAAFAFLVLTSTFSGFSILKRVSHSPSPPPPPSHPSSASSQPPSHSQPASTTTTTIHYVPITPHRSSKYALTTPHEDEEETPETDASPASLDFKALPPAYEGTPSRTGRTSPAKERGRSPGKGRVSPFKRF